ncbi:MAG: DctP family TRAP transporter solute-binding subunit [Magnetococcales bacterium]|nr:DctP family TRAP transporter solute-binding subunit [Magnetococcales bacterium]
MPQDSAMGVAAERFAQTIGSQTHGALRVDVFPEGQLGNDLKMAEMARDGELDIVLIPTAKMSILLPALQYVDLPFYFSSPDMLYRMLDGEPGQLLLSKLHAVGLVGATFWGNGFKQFTANRSIHTPEDFHDLKVRVMQSRLIMDQYADLGAKPIPIEFREIRQALADGVVEAQENPLSAIAAMGIHQVQSHLTLSDHAYLAYVLAISETLLARLPHVQQTLLLETAKTITPFQREETARREEQFLQQIRQAGVRINRLTEQERAVFTRKLRHLSLQFEEVIGSDIISKTEELLFNWQSRQGKGNEIVVGLDTALSQTRARAGLAIKQGARLAMHEINQAGGVLGRPLALLAFDDMAIPTRGVDHFRFLAKQDAVVAILGGTNSPVVLAQSELADELKIPFLVARAAAAGVVEHTDRLSPFSFRISANDRLAGPFLVDAALAKGSRVALVLEETAWGRNMLPHLQNHCKQRNITPVLVAWINRGEHDFTTHMQAMRDSGADVVVLVVNADESVSWLQAVAIHKPTLPIVSHWGIIGGDFFAKTRHALDKVELTFLQTFSPARAQEARLRALQKSYGDLFGAGFQDMTLPLSGFAQAYDLVHLLARAIHQAGTTNRQAIRDALEHIADYKGLIKDYHPPFTSDRHDALDRNDYFMARFDASGHIVPQLSGAPP